MYEVFFLIFFLNKIIVRLWIGIRVYFVLDFVMLVFFVVYFCGEININFDSLCCWWFVVLGVEIKILDC